MQTALANFVWVLHVAFVAFVITTPFTDSEELLTLYVATIPFVCLHWIYNNDTCMLTLLEKHFRGVADDNSFFHALFSPIYTPSGFSDACTKRLTWIVTIVLWLIALQRLRKTGFKFAKHVASEMRSILGAATRKTTS